MKTIAYFSSLLISLLLCFTSNLQSQITRSEAPAALYDPLYPFHPNTNLSFSSSNLPIVIITMKTRMADKAADTRVEADMKIIYRTDGSRNSMADTVSTNLTNSSIINYAGRIGIKYRGNTSYSSSDKKPFGVRTEDSEGTKQEVSILGMGSDSDWALLAPYNDKSMIRDVLTFDLMRGFLEYTPIGKYCELVLDGIYQGVYIMAARVKRGSNRIDLPKPKTSGDGLTGGYHLEIDRTAEPGFSSNYFPKDLYGNDLSNKPWYQYKYPDKEDYDGGMQTQQSYIINRIRELENAVASSDFKNPETGYRKHLDVQSVIDFMLAQEFTHNVDGYRLSTPIYKYTDSKDPRFKMSIWDFNISLGNANYYEGWATEGWAWNMNPILQRNSDTQKVPFWFYRLLSDEDFVKEIKDRWKYYRQTNFSDENIKNKIDSLVALLSEAQVRNFQIWNRWGYASVWPIYYVSTSWNDELSYLRNWISRRIAWIDSQLAPMPTNRVANGTFDADFPKGPTSSTVSLTNWVTSGTVGLSTTAPHSGTYCLSFQSAGEAYQTITQLPNGNYTLKAWVRTVKNPNASIIIRNHGSANITRSIDTSSTYQEITISNIEVTNRACDISFKTSFSSDGITRLYIDDIQFFQEKDKDTVYTTSVETSICQGDTYNFLGKNLTVTGLYQDTLISSNNCDSIIKLSLTVNPTYLISEEASICSGITYSFGNKDLTTSGIYYDTLQSINGCDSIIKLTLTVNPTYLITQEASICFGESYHFANKDLTTSGTYHDSLQTIYGCDSIIQLTLIVLPKVNINLGNDTTIKANEHLILDAGSGYKTYLWSTGETTQALRVDSNLGIGTTNIWVKATTNNDCQGSDTIQITIENLSNITQLSDKERFLLYPNPTSGKVNIEFDNIANRDVTLFNTFGQQVYHKKYHSQKIELNLSDLPAGTYILKIDNTIQRKIILNPEIK